MLQNFVVHRCHSYVNHCLQVKGAQLWGTDIYTNDSDLVAGSFLITVLILLIVHLLNKM
jgi:hypothetical protein